MGYHITPPWLIRDEESSSMLHGRDSPRNNSLTGSLQKEGLSEGMKQVVMSNDERDETPTSTSGSDSSSSGNGDEFSLTKTSATMASSLSPEGSSTADATMDSASISPSISQDGNDLLCEPKESRGENGALSSPSQDQHEVTLHDAGISISDSDQTPNDTINARPVSVVGFLPTFYVQSPLLRKTSPMIFLQNATLLEQTLRPITQDDLAQLERLGEILQGSGSYEDTFKLFRVFLMQTVAQSLSVAERFPLVLRGLVSLARNATTPDHRSEVREMLKSMIPKELKLHSKYAAQGCMLYAFLGNCLRQDGKLDLAEEYCSLALHSYRSMVLEHRRPAHQAIIVESLALVIEDRASRDLQHVFDVRVHKLRLQLCGGLDSADKHLLTTQLLDIFRWCHGQLKDATFMRELKAIVGTLSHKSRCITHRAKFYRTVLFSLLWKQAEVKILDMPSYPVANASPAFYWSPGSLVSLELFCGSSPVETLSAITRMITDNIQDFDHPDVVERLVQAASDIENKSYLRSIDAFLTAFVAPLRGGDQHATPKLSKVMETFTREFMETNFDLRLSENAFQDPRLHQKVYRGSFAPSLTSTMLSTPHSSWSMFNSNTSFSRRISMVLESNGEPERPTSSPRWRNSALSMATSASSRFAASISVRRSSIVSDTTESKKSGRKVDQYKISSPILVSTTNTQVLHSGFIGPAHRTEPGDDPMDIDSEFA